MGNIYWQRNDSLKTTEISRFTTEILRTFEFMLCCYAVLGTESTSGGGYDVPYFGYFDHIGHHLALKYHL